MKKILFVLSLGLVTHLALADNQTDANSRLTPNMVGNQLTPDEVQKAENLGKLISQYALTSMQGEPAHKDEEIAAHMARKADDIADATIAQQRNDVLKFLGINPDGDSSLYYFVSWSMPLEMLRSYAVEAMWSGGTLVFRGIPDGMTLRDYTYKYAYKLIYGKGASANISIDPRLYDAYNVTVVPTIVYTQERRNFQCMGTAQQRYVMVNKQAVPYHACPQVDPNKYWKIEGSITTDYALREIIDAGGSGARVFLDALKKGFATGTVVPKKMQPFTGDWKDVFTPEEMQAIQAASNSVQSASSPLSTGTTGQQNTAQSR